MSQRFPYLSLPVAIVVAVSAIANARAAEPRYLNTYMMKAYELVKHRSTGYDRSKYFSKNLDYGSDEEAIKAKKEGFTMCNAAVTEVIIEAINLYYADHTRWSPQNDIPAISWTTRSWTELMPDLFGHDYREYPSLEPVSKNLITRGLNKDIDDFHSEHGMALALEKFGLGEQIEFKDARPGDIITFDRDGGLPGHSVIFLAFLNDRQEEVLKYRGNIVGFKYFSVQKSGFGERWAYFKVPPGIKKAVEICPHSSSTAAKKSRCDDYNRSEPTRNFPLLKDERQIVDCCIIERARDKEHARDEDAPRVGRIFSPPWKNFKKKQEALKSQESKVEKNVRGFLKNAWRKEEQVRLWAKGAVAIESKNETLEQRANAREAADYIKKVKELGKKAKEPGIDLRAVAQGAAVRRIDRQEFNSIYKITPKQVKSAANRQVTPRMRAEIEQRVQTAGERAASPPKGDELPSIKFTGETD